MARKADLRPSPISSTLSSDLLTISANFHVNYLPDILSTFKGLFTGRIDGLGLKEFDVENVIKPGVVLDGQLAYEQDSRLSLIEAANRTAFRRNNLYFPQNGSASITPESLDTFHQQTIERAGNKKGYSLLLSVNDYKVIERSELIDSINNIGIPIMEEVVKNTITETTFNFNEGKEFRIELNDSNFNEFLLNFPIKFGGFIQKNYQTSSIFDSLLKKRFPSAFVSVTSDTSLMSIYFKFSFDQSASDIKKQLEESIKELRSLPDLVKDEDFTWAKERSKFNQSLSIDSRQNRLLTFSHHFALTGKLPEISSHEDFSNEELRALLKESIQGTKPVLISKGNYKKLPYYNELL